MAVHPPAAWIDPDNVNADKSVKIRLTYKFVKYPRLAKNTTGAVDVLLAFVCGDRGADGGLWVCIEGRNRAVAEVGEEGGKWAVCVGVVACDEVDFYR